jgi:hypothetical protein
MPTTYVRGIVRATLQDVSTTDDEGNTSLLLGVVQISGAIPGPPNTYCFDIADAQGLPAHLQEALETQGPGRYNLPPGLLAFVLEGTYEDTEDVDGQTVTVIRRVKMKDIPGNKTPIEENLRPHAWLGDE